MDGRGHTEEESLTPTRGDELLAFLGRVPLQSKKCSKQSDPGLNPEKVIQNNKRINDSKKSLGLAEQEQVNKNQEYYI